MFCHLNCKVGRYHVDRQVTVMEPLGVSLQLEVDRSVANKVNKEELVRVEKVVRRWKGLNGIRTSVRNF